jgi:3-oxoacyl-[acyl-carrier protein] reductase/(S)-1-phenylethanol dehydrogenase
MTASHEPRTVLITGAVGGIGRALARGFAAAGHRLVLTDLVDCGTVATEESLGNAVVHSAACDLEDVAALQRFTDAVLAVTRVDVLVNNAAHQQPIALDALDVDDLRRFHRINVEAPFQLSKACWGGMRTRGWGRIVNIVSGSAWMPPPAFLGYVTSKMGLVGLTRALAAELGDHGITVNGVTPSLTRHARNADALPEAMWEAMAQRQAIKRPATPEDLVGAVMFLASEEARFITGQTLFADGGLVMN